MKDQIPDKSKLCRNRRIAIEDPGEEIVISGIAGRYPDSHNVKELQDNLLNKVDLISRDYRRWKLDHPEVPQRTGKVWDVERFDSEFFSVHFKQAHTMDPMSRMLLEHTFEALVDAGVNPNKLRGTKTGVFIGACFSESERTWFYEKLHVNGLGIPGCSRSMLANRISYWLGISGPSYTVDSACSSSLYAMEHAYRAIRDGHCDAAIVGGANLCLHPYVSLQFSRLGVLSMDGKCKSFDRDANGYTRSEAINIIFMQKAKDAKRVYATMVHGKTNCDGFKEQGITFPSFAMQKELLTDFYEEIQISPLSLQFIEAHGTGTRVGDPEELNALDVVFCTDRDTPLKIGSVKSNLGHSEPACGVCSVSKVIIAMETGLIPANLHYNSPREGVPGLFEGRLQVVTDTTPWEGGLVGVNSFGFGGANCHVLLQSNDKEKINQGIPKDNLPRLVVVSGRTEEAVKSLLDDVESRPVDAEHIRLLHDVHEEEIFGHPYRGYTIVGKDIREPTREIQHYTREERPVWYIFTGMGTQWAGMGEDLLEIPVFHAAIEKCDAVLKPHRIDIFNIITSKDKKTFDNILHSFVGIAAVQIGLVDIMNLLGIVPDNLIGHSIGELGCAYADGSLTAEQVVLAAYSYGLAFIETKTIYGSMADVGLSYDDIKDHCPPDVDVVYFNGPESVTISGPSGSVKTLVAKLQAKKVFAREVPCSNIAYHSRYIANAGPKLLANLKKVIPTPKPRSQKWLSTSIPQTQWSAPEAKLCSAEYHTNNLLNPVLFEETVRNVPTSAVCIEVAPHGLLQAILRSSLPQTVTNVPLMQRGRNNVDVLLQAVGKMFNAGLQPQLAKLYPDVQFPVSRGTPMISPHIKWEHSEDWYVMSYKRQEKIAAGERIVEVALTDEDFEYMSGHVIDGRNLLPATGYLCLIWETIGMMLGELYTEVPVIFEDVKFLRATNIPKDGMVELTLMVHKASGQFEVSENGTSVVSGIVHVLSKPESQRMNPSLIPDYNEPQEMTTRDIYKELRLRGYQYAGLFRGIKSASITGREAMIEWTNNYCTFLDNMLQLSMISIDTRGLYVPTGIKKIVIDVKHHMNVHRQMSEEKCFKAVWIKHLDCLVSGGVEIHGTKVSAIARKRPLGEPVLENYKFVAHRDNAQMSLGEVVRLATHIAYENQLGHKVKTIEYVEENEVTSSKNLASPLISETLGDLPLIQADVGIITPNVAKFEGIELAGVNLQDSKKLNPEGNILLAVGRGFLSKGSKIASILSQLLLALKEGGFILSREPLDFSDYKVARNNGLEIVLEKISENERILLLRKRNKLPKKAIPVLVTNDDFKWIAEVQEIMKSEAENDYAGSIRVLLIGRGDDNGLLGLVNCLRQEPGGEIVHGLLLQDNTAPEFSLQNPFYADQLCQDLVVNVLRDNKWGSYRHLMLKALEPKPAHHIWVNQSIRGDLGSLQWFEGPIAADFKHEDLVHVYYASLNFRDIMLATGKLAVEVVAKTRLLQECVIGLEFCGIDMKGKRVMGMAENRGLTNLIVCDRFMTWEVPKQWSLEEAATVPVTYGTAYYALYSQGHMKKGDKVLIHSGTGGVGQAAINLALFEGCEVFTTVGTKEKRDFIRKQFPQIPESHIGNSRDTTFEQMILMQTKGRGVDIVLNSLAEEKLQASVRCLSRRGRFLEIGKFDLAANNPLGMEAFSREISFHGVLLDNVFVSSKEKKQKLKDLVQSGLDSGAVKPLVSTVFPKEQLENAFRFMAAGNHIGKVIVQVRELDAPLTAPALGHPLVYCKEDHAYVILGGLGGFGLELADWLVLRGARNIVLTSRTGIKNGYQKKRINVWESYGANVVVVGGKDASKRDECAEILKIANNLAPVAGIFNLAVILKDSIFENQTIESFEESFRPKAWSTKVLDELSRRYCPKLDIFCVFSSVSCGRGNAGQTNYGMSNSIMERVCEKRAADGLPALAVQWGAVGDVGLVAEMQDDHKELVIGGTLQQRISNCLQVLDGFLKQSRPIVSSMVVAEKRASGSGSGNIVNVVLDIMGLKDLKSVSHHTSLAELGMDSMMSVEIKQTLEREFEVFLTAQDIRGLNFAKLIEMSTKDDDDKKESKQSPSENEGDLLGMQMLYRVIGDQDIVPDVCLKVKTKEEPGRAEVLLIPGIEGLASIFKDIATKLKPPACCLQLGVTAKQTTLDEMVQILLPHVKERIKGQMSFIIVGYSFGSMVAIELARQLEKTGKQGRLILLDGSPESMKMIVSQNFAAETEEQLQNNILLGIGDVATPAMRPQMAPEIQKFKTWEEKLNRFIEFIPKEGVPKEFALTTENQKAMCTVMYQRIQAVQNYDMSNVKPINSPITLLKASAQSVKSISDDFGLQQFTNHKVDVHTVSGNHITMLDNDKVVAAINGEPLEDNNEGLERRMMEDGKSITPVAEINRTEEQQQIY